MIHDLGTDIKVACTDFVKQGDAFAAFTFFQRNLSGEALAKRDVQTELRRHKFIVLVRITSWLRFPEFMSIYGIQINAGSQRLDTVAFI